MDECAVLVTPSHLLQAPKLVHEDTHGLRPRKLENAQLLDLGLHEGRHLFIREVEDEDGTEFIENSIRFVGH